jgi:catechol 2,3-dioxygenase-like lactoylglutathione lyase family enzyme
MHQGIHHVAYVVRDQEATRQFYEDVLGLPLIATWSEVGPFPGFGERLLEYCHTFYELPDGSALSFFAFADDDAYKALRNRNGLAHVALHVTPEVQEEMRVRLEAAGFHPHRVDHGYVQSLYVEDPDRLNVEFTAEPPVAAEVATWQRESAHETLARWLGGDHTPNNDFRHR